MSALKLSVDTQGREFQKMKDSVERITKENESLKKELLRAKEKLKEQKEKTNSLWSSLEEIEQYTRKMKVKCDHRSEFSKTRKKEYKKEFVGDIRSSREVLYVDGRGSSKCC